MPYAPASLSRPEPEKNFKRKSAAARGYGRRWQWASKAFLDQNPLCGQRAGGLQPVMSECHDKGYTTQATLVDHVIPHRGDMGLFWDQANWQAMCATCHGRKGKAGL